MNYSHGDRQYTRVDSREDKLILALVTQRDNPAELLSSIRQYRQLPTLAYNGVPTASTESTDYFMDSANSSGAEGAPLAAAARVPSGCALHLLLTHVAYRPLTTGTSAEDAAAAQKYDAIALEVSNLLYTCIVEQGLSDVVEDELLRKPLATRVMKRMTVEKGSTTDFVTQIWSLLSATAKEEERAYTNDFSDIEAPLGGGDSDAGQSQQQCTRPRVRVLQHRLHSLLRLRRRQLITAVLTRLVSVKEWQRASVTSACASAQIVTTLYSHLPALRPCFFRSFVTDGAPCAPLLVYAPLENIFHILFTRAAEQHRGNYQEDEHAVAGMDAAEVAAQKRLAAWSCLLCLCEFGSNCSSSGALNGGITSSEDDSAADGEEDESSSDESSDAEGDSAAHGEAVPHTYDYPPRHLLHHLAPTYVSVADYVLRHWRRVAENVILPALAPLYDVETTSANRHSGHEAAEATMEGAIAVMDTAAAWRRVFLHLVFSFLHTLVCCCPTDAAVASVSVSGDAGARVQAMYGARCACLSSPAIVCAIFQALRRWPPGATETSSAAKIATATAKGEETTDGAGASETPEEEEGEAAAVQTGGADPSEGLRVSASAAGVDDETDGGAADMEAAAAATAARGCISAPPLPTGASPLPRRRQDALLVARAREMAVEAVLHATTSGSSGNAAHRRHSNHQHTHTHRQRRTSSPQRGCPATTFAALHRPATCSAAASPHSAVKALITLNRAPLLSLVSSELMRLDRDGERARVEDSQQRDRLQYLQHLLSTSV